MLPLACGSVRLRQPLESEPPSPREESASAPTKATGTSARRMRTRTPACRRASSEGARWALAKPMARPAASRTRTIATRAMPSWWPADARSASGTLSVLSGFEAKAQKADEAAAERARGQDGHAAQAQGHDREPQRAPHAQRQQRAARVGEQEGHDEQSERRIGERADGRMARAPGAQPQARRPRGGGHEAHGVPVAERLAQAGVDLVGVQRAGEDLGQQRVAADHHAGEDDAARAATASGAGRAVPGRRRPPWWPGS